jgi:NhaA family Na+:H+ antiporter
MLNALRDFLRLETASGTLLMAAAVGAMLVANSPGGAIYASLLELPVEIRIGGFEIAKPLLLWINDGFMAIFFLLVGLELKREFLEGQLSNRSQILLPAMAALGGMLVPALIYVAINRGDPVALEGWAIPAATDIAFALAVLALLGNRVPLSLRVFLVSIAIFDDLGAIVVIALFYSSKLSVLALSVGAVCIVVLLTLNRLHVPERTPYLLVGLVMWAAILKSGVHATLAGVILAFFIPMQNREKTHSPLKELEHDLHTAVAFGILPAFAFANGGISLAGLSWDYLLHPVPLGVLSGLFVGKQVGVLLFTWLTVSLGLARLPADFTWLRVYGIAIVCGVGFTMSLFIASLAFETSGRNMLFDERLGIIIGSLLSGITGYFVLRAALPARQAAATGLAEG